MDYPVEQFLSTYAQLKTQLKNRQISQETFVEQAKALRTRDPNGYFWAVDPYRDLFLRYDGQQWVVDQSIKKYETSQAKKSSKPATPPAAQAAAPAGAVMPARATTLKQSTRQRLKATPILALLPAVACGGLWFLYTFIGVFKYEGLSGIDFLTPAIIVAVPAAFWLFGKQIDKLIKPLYPLVGPMPKALRYGIILGVPLIFGCGCSFISTSGYGLLRFSTLISVLVAGVLMRIPEVKK